MSDDLRPLEDWLAPLLDAIGLAGRRELARTMARELRRNQQQRIAAQLNPDGSVYAPRKPTLRSRKGGIRRAVMFTKIRRTSHLKTTASPDLVAIGFTGRVARIASVHQFGLRDRVWTGGPEIQYAARGLLGLTGADRDLIRDRIIRALATFGA